MGLSEGRRLHKQQGDRELAVQQPSSEAPGHLCVVKGNDFLIPKHCLLAGSHTRNSCQQPNTMYRSLAQALLYNKHRSEGLTMRIPFACPLSHLFLLRAGPPVPAQLS